MRFSLALDGFNLRWKRSRLSSTHPVRSQCWTSYVTVSWLSSQKVLTSLGIFPHKSLIASQCCVPAHIIIPASDCFFSQDLTHIYDVKMSKGASNNTISHLLCSHFSRSHTKVSSDDKDLVSKG